MLVVTYLIQTVFLKTYVTVTLVIDICWTVFAVKIQDKHDYAINTTFFFGCLIEFPSNIKSSIIFLGDIIKVFQHDCFAWSLNFPVWSQPAKAWNSTSARDLASPRASDDFPILLSRLWSPLPISIIVCVHKVW